MSFESRKKSLYNATYYIKWRERILNKKKEERLITKQKKENGYKTKTAIRQIESNGMTSKNI